MNDETPEVEFRHVSVSFDGKRALDDVSFKLLPGRMVIITGASGSGKSVLLRLAIGFLKPDEGRILIRGREIEQLDEDELLTIRGRLLGVVFQEESLFTGLSVYDNVAYRPVEHGWPEAETDTAVREVLRFVALEEDADKLPEELSGGMKRRLEIARALVGWPSIMLLDEPTLGLDPITATSILDLVVRARDINKISTLYVTKKLHEIPYLSNNYAAPDGARGFSILEAAARRPPSETTVLLLEQGRIAFRGRAAEFEASALPAVTYMTHAGAGPQAGGGAARVGAGLPHGRFYDETQIGTRL
jgi:phospholipid/cholesterol/gamma-HCH transport system ATP-binding protein